MTITSDQLLRIGKYLTALQSLQKSEYLPMCDLVMAVHTESPEIVRDDLTQIGIDTGHELRVVDTITRIERLLTDAESSTVSGGIDAPVFLQVGNAIEDMVPVSIESDPARAHIQEAAWKYAEKNPEHFLFALGRMAPDRAPFWHQTKTAKDVIERYRGTVIIADEVGLGKTVIGCLLALEELHMMPGANVLILAPANLVGQWCTEFEDFFEINLMGVPNASLTELASERIVLMSTDRAKSEHIAPFILAREWDLLIVDEAHELKNSESLRSRFVYTIRAVNRVYLTATPVQNSGYDMYSLVTSLRPGFLNVRKWFTSNYMLDERSVHRKDILQDKLSAVVSRYRRVDVGMDGFKDRLTPKTVWIDDWTEQETLCYDALLEMLRGTYRRSLGAATPIARPSGIEEHVSQFVLVSMLIMREMASHTAAAMKTLDTALRGHLEKLALALGDRTGLESLDQFLKVHSKNLKHEDTHGKAKALLDELENLFDDTHSVLVYVVFRETLTAVSELIKKRFPDIEVIEYHGKLSKEDKKRQVRRFWKSKKACFVSMDSGGQGLNLQVADTVVNYDYPWNPMKVEQRVGRVDRYGQTSDNIRIVNFITRGTIEVYVYHTLQSKLEVFRNVIGDMMSPLQVEELWEDRLMLGIGELILSSRDADDMRARFEGLDESSLRKYLDRYERYVARSEKWVGK